MSKIHRALVFCSHSVLFLQYKINCFITAAVSIRLCHTHLYIFFKHLNNSRRPTVPNRETNNYHKTEVQTSATTWMTVVLEKIPGKENDPLLCSVTESE